MRPDVTNRHDVSLIVRNFYANVRADETLSPIFDSVISDWEPHLEKLIDFWEMNLFGGKNYSGNPIAIHQKTDVQTKNGVSPYHFGTWLNLWFATIDSHFEGENANVLKFRARKMQTVLMVAIFENREKAFSE